VGDDKEEIMIVYKMVTRQQDGLACLETIGRAVRDNVSTDWTPCQNERAQLQIIVKCILRKHGYPPDKQEKGTQTLLEQVILVGGKKIPGWVAIG
jgi:type I restriction enzyme R subunit